MSCAPPAFSGAIWEIVGLPQSCISAPHKCDCGTPSVMSHTCDIRIPSSTQSLKVLRLQDFFYLYGRANLFAGGHINKKIAVVGFQTLEVPPRRAVGMGVKRSKLQVCVVANPIFACQNHIKQKKGRLLSSFLYPLRGSTALLAVGSRVLESLHPPDLPGREAHPGFSLPKGRGSNGFSRHRGSVAVATCGGAGVRPR